MERWRFPVGASPSRQPLQLEAIGDGVIGRPSLWILKILGAALQAEGENEVLGGGLKHQKEKRSMDHFAGLDVSVKETSICIVDDTGRIVREVKVSSEPEALLKVLGNPIYRFKRIGLEAGPLSQWLFSGLAEAGLPVVCVETRHMQGRASRFPHRIVDIGIGAHVIDRTTTKALGSCFLGLVIARGETNRIADS